MTHTQRMALLSVGASIATIALKFSAYFLTGSVSLLSDAAESLVNLVAALVAFGVLSIVAQPADARHTYGHDKAEYFSSGVEGALIVVAAVSILYAAIDRFLHPAPIEQLGIGLLVAAAAAAVNYVTAKIMLRVAAEHDSITLEADARHLLTDVWTTGGIIAGLIVVLLTPPQWQIIDPIMAVLVALHILKTGFGLMRRSLDGLMDVALPHEELSQIQAAIQTELPPGAEYHALRTRKAGAKRFIDFHLLMPEHTSIGDAHQVCDRIEAAIERKLARTSVTIHVEPIESHTDHGYD
ncbi:MAG: cation diffusion facilitator family transporter [Gammaproteobacteria bacterium]